MTNSNTVCCRSFIGRLFSVWYRHMRVYTKNIITNGFPPFVEPLIFLSAVGLGLGNYITEMDSIPFIKFLASGLVVTTTMFTASFECTYGTYVRLEYDKAYDGILGAPIGVSDLLIGEMIWAGTKGMFFSTAVLTVISIFRILSPKLYLVIPILGFGTGVMFATLGLLVTSFVKDLNQFNFFFTGLISPMFFFSGVFFSIDNLPKILRVVSEFLPLTHSVRLVRAFSLTGLAWRTIFDLGYIIVFTVVIGWFAIRRLRKRLID